MSRIEEARQKTAGVIGAPARTAEMLQEPGTVLAEAVLTSYPLESRDRVRVPADARQFGTAPVELPATVEEGERSLRFSPADAAKLVVQGASPFAIEQYRRIAATLHELQAERDLRAVMVTSVLPQEGKTLTIVNLALTLSESYGKRVLLIDADLRRPSVHRLLRLPNRIGLVDALGSAKESLPAIQVTRRLSVLTGGSPQPDPMARLASDRMRLLLESVKQQFDWVLLDTPPVLLMPDASVVSHLTGAVILVIGAGRTPYAVTEKAIADLGREVIVGAVLNQVDDELVSDVGYYGY